MKTLIDEKTPVTQVPFVALDTETCGLYEAKVVELAGVRFRGGVEEGRFQTLVDPREPIPAEVTAIHGITNEMVSGAPTIREALVEFLEFSKGAIWLAHNSPFDTKILTAELYRSELPIPSWFVLCSCRLSRRFNSGFQSHSLGYVCQQMGVVQTQAHRALGDSVAVMEIFQRMLARHPAMTFGELLALHGKPYDFDRAIETSNIIPKYPCIGKSII